MSKARDLANLLSDGSSLADGTVAASEVTGLSTVATSGDFTDLSNQPAPFDPTTLANVAVSGSFNDLSNQPAAFDPSTLASVAVSGSFTDLSNQPSPFDPSTLATVATSGAYSALSGTPTLGTASAQATGAFATAAQGTKADTALQAALAGVTSVDATTAAAFGAAGVGAAAKGTLGGAFNFVSAGSAPSGYTAGGWLPSQAVFSMGSSIFRFAGSQRALLRSTDIGASWSLVKNWQGGGNSGPQGYTEFAHDGQGNGVLVLGDYYGGALRTSNYGASWSYVTISGYIGKIASGGNGYFLAWSFQGDSVYRSTNNGANWTHLASSQYSSGIKENGTGNTLVSYHESGGTVTFKRIPNWKTGWSPATTTTISLMDTEDRIGRIENDNGTNFVTSCGYYSTNDGVTWARGTNPPTGTNITYVGGRFIVHEGPDYAWSTNGSEWSYAPMGLGKVGHVTNQQWRGFKSNRDSDHTTMHSQIRGHGETLTRSYVLGYAPYNGYGYSDLT